jgi:predicted phosphoribosyltransferase
MCICSYQFFFKLQLQFKDRQSAGDMLAEVFKSSLKKYIINNAENNKKEKQDDIIALVIPRGGVIKPTQ